MVAWGKYLMPRGPFAEDRHLLAPTAEEREAFVEDFAARGKVAVERRTILVKILGLASGGLRRRARVPAPALARAAAGEEPLQDELAEGLVPCRLRRSQDQGRRPRGRRVHHGLPAGRHRRRLFPDDAHPRDHAACERLPAAAAQVRERAGHVGAGRVTSPSRRSAPTPVVPVGPLRGAHRAAALPVPPVAVRRDRCRRTPIFGPAPRPLPQLPLYVDDAGYLRAQDGLRRAGRPRILGAGWHD